MLPVLLAALLATTCAVSPREDPYPEIIGPITGQSPAWLIDGSAGHAGIADERIKTLWVLAKRAAGDLRISGRRLDGDGSARFQDGGVDGTPGDALEIPDPEWRRRAWPGNATAEVKAAYAFVPNYVIYPSRGCWAFDVAIGTELTRIVIEIK
jgi:hypothetical protein